MVSVEQLKEVRPYVIVGSFIVAAIVTPPDVLSQLLRVVDDETGEGLTDEEEALLAAAHSWPGSQAGTGSRRLAWGRRGTRHGA